MDKKKIVEAIKAAVERTGRLAYYESQHACPTESGNLKNSGLMINSTNEFVIKYSSEYAEAIERGWSGGKVWSAGHIRKGGVLVKGHYKNQPAKEGVHFIENSLRKFFKEPSSGNKTVFQQNVLEELESHCAPAKVIEG